jgi:hypothetical protein
MKHYETRILLMHQLLEFLVKAIWKHLLDFACSPFERRIYGEK